MKKNLSAAGVVDKSGLNKRQSSTVAPGLISFVYKIKAEIPERDSKSLSRSILGKQYDLSVVLVGNAVSRKFNSLYRGVDRPTNILSFALSAHEGELLLNLPLARKEAVLAKARLADYLLYLLAHGMLHLKGYAHGTIMEKRELTALKKFVSVDFLDWLMG